MTVTHAPRAAEVAKPSALTNPLFINLVLLGGSTQEKIAAAKAAGFDQIELWRQDLEAFGGDAPELRRVLSNTGIALTDYQVLLDFDGAPASIRADKRAEALRMLDTAAALGATTLLSPASTHADCVAEQVDEDMHWLAQQAAQRNLGIAYEGMAWSTINHSLPAAWACVQRVGAPNLGVVVDAFHIFARGRDASDLDGILTDRIFLVQLSDLTEKVDSSNVTEVARHRRLLPGQGHFPIDSILAKLKLAGYTGPIGLEVFNDVMKSRDPKQVTMEAMQALKSVWK